MFIIIIVRKVNTSGILQEGQLQLREKDKQTLCQELRRKEANLAEADQILRRKDREIQTMKEQVWLFVIGARNQQVIEVTLVAGIKDIAG